MRFRVIAFLWALSAAAVAQNVVTDSLTRQTLPPLEPGADRAKAALMPREHKPPNPPQTAEAKRTAAKLALHVQRLVEGWPWRPFHCTLGISGSETYFDHPDELFYSLAVALPYLPEPLRKDVQALLARELAETPPYALDGFDGSKGRSRERYDVPENLRRTGRGKARSLFGIAAFAEYLPSIPGDSQEVHWDRIKERVRPFLDDAYGVESEKADAEKLNGDLAGLIAFARFAKSRSEADNYQKASRRISQLARLRVDLERADPQLLTPATTATKRLHHFKLARFDHLGADVAEMFSEEERTLAASRLKSFRDARPGWWMAFAERFVGGENYISPPHLSHAIFAGAALVEKVDATTLAGWIDVPWCEADFFFIEKCVLTLSR